MYDDSSFTETSVSVAAAFTESGTSNTLETIRSVADFSF